MNELSISTQKLANEAALYNLYLYLIHLHSPTLNESFETQITSLEQSYNNHSINWETKDIQRLNILTNAITNNESLGKSKLVKYAYNSNGLTSCVFISHSGDIHIAFKGTGSGEWIDNGEGLAGTKIATEQQIEALSWFYKTVRENGWTNKNNIILSGHSKGGNKAQFIAMHSNLVDYCFSFSGQGFSPEALSSFKDILGTDFDKMRNKIYSFSADNDYVNVLGERLMPDSNIFYFMPTTGLHGPEAILNTNGLFTAQAKQGKLSHYVEEVSQDLMRIKPFARQYATIGIMNLFQKYLGDGTLLKGDEISLEHTILGVNQLISAILTNMIRN